MVTPTSHLFVFHWLQFTSMCCLFPLATCPIPLTECFPVATSMGKCICHHSLSSTTSIGQGDIPIITLLILSSAWWSCQQHLLIQQHLQDMVIFRKSPWSYHCICNNIHCVQHLQVMLTYYTTNAKSSVYIYIVAYWSLAKLPIRDSLHRTHLWK